MSNRAVSFSSGLRTRSRYRASSPWCAILPTTIRVPRSAAMVAGCLQPGLFTKEATTSLDQGSSNLRGGLGVDTTDTDRLWIEQVTKVRDH